MTSPAAMTSAEAAGAMARRELSSTELVGACLERIAEQEDRVGAWEFIDPELALAQARDRDGEEPRSALHGIPVGVKDLIDTADMPTAYGSPIYAGNRPRADATCVARLREAGAVVLGKTVTTEFAYFHPRKTANPHDPSRTPGGSSSGSAAAVAAGMVPLSLGTQTAGSIIRPAAFCGVFGLKPTYGILPVAGIKPLSPRLDTLGGFAHSVEDLAILAAALGGQPPAVDFTPVAPEGPPRIGLHRSPHWHEAEPAGQEAVEATAERLAREGARVQEVGLGESFAGLVEAQRTVMASDMAESLAAEHERHGEELSEELREFLAEGRAIDQGAYGAALQLAERCAAELDAALAGQDGLLTPAVKGEAPIGRPTGDPLFCRTWTLLGVPAVSVPGLAGPSGMPLGVQLVGRAGHDGRLLGVAGWVAERLG